MKLFKFCLNITAPARITEAIPKYGQIVPKVGMPIAKFFPNTNKKGDKDEKRYCGTIVGVDVDDNGEDLYHIVYDDGDEEDMHTRECRMSCLLYNKTTDSGELDSDSDF